MTKEERDVQRKLKVLRHVEKTGQVARTCRYFGVGRSSFYRWRAAYEQRGEAGLVNAKPIPKNPANQTPPEIVDKVQRHPGRGTGSRPLTSTFFRLKLRKGPGAVALRGGHPLRSLKGPPFRLVRRKGPDAVALHIAGICGLSG